MRDWTATSNQNADKLASACAEIAQLKSLLEQTTIGAELLQKELRLQTDLSSTVQSREAGLKTQAEELDSKCRSLEQATIAASRATSRELAELQAAGDRNESSYSHKVKELLEELELDR